MQKNDYRRKIKIAYGYDFEGVVTANGEVGISGSRCKSPRAQIEGAPRDSSRLILVLM
jgi:hypothetical protein